MYQARQHRFFHRIEATHSWAQEIPGERSADSGVLHMRSPLACSWLVAGVVLIAAFAVPAQADVGPSDSATTGGFQDVYFSSDESELTASAKRRLDRDAKTVNELIKNFPNLKIDLLGHADWIGSDGYNLALSERRANIVKAYLISQAVPAERISTYAYGESLAIVASGIDEGRALNRPELRQVSENAQLSENVDSEPGRNTIVSSSLGAVSSVMASPMAR